MWNLLFAEYIKAKEIMKTKSGVKVTKNSLWVQVISEAMSRLEIEINLDDMALDSLVLNVITSTRYSILFNPVDVFVCVYVCVFVCVLGGGGGG